VGTMTYTGVNSALFAYYIKAFGNTYFSHDGFNGDGKAHALAYAGTGQNTGCWWQCWEESPIPNYLDADFNDAVVFMESMNPTPVSKSSWGQVKARFRSTPGMPPPRRARRVRVPSHSGSRAAAIVRSGGLARW